MKDVLNLAKTQQFLAQLYTRRPLREEFFSHPAAVAESWGLEAASIQHLLRLDRAQVEFFASSLIYKRLNEVRKLLPLIAKALGKDFSPLFLDYAETDSPVGIKKHWRDALAFCDFLLQTERDWVSDLVRYERASLQRWDSKPRWRCERYRYAIEPLIQSLQESPEAPVLIQKSTRAIEVQIGRFQWLFQF